MVWGGEGRSTGVGWDGGGGGGGERGPESNSLWKVNSSLPTHAMMFCCTFCLF